MFCMYYLKNLATYDGFVPFITTPFLFWHCYPYIWFLFKCFLIISILFAAVLDYSILLYMNHSQVSGIMIQQNDNNWSLFKPESE